MVTVLPFGQRKRIMHHCSNSCNPVLRYSPLLNEQHSRRSNKLSRETLWDLGIIKTSLRNRKRLISIKLKMKIFKSAFSDMVLCHNGQDAKTSLGRTVFSNTAVWLRRDSFSDSRIATLSFRLIRGFQLKLFKNLRWYA